MGEDFVAVKARTSVRIRIVPEPVAHPHWRAMPSQPPSESAYTATLLRIAVPLLLVAAALRFWSLGSVPPGLFRDEVEKGWTALELWQTGRQGYVATDGTFVVSRLLPVFTDAVGVKTSAVYQYMTAPVVGLFGLSPFTTRFVAALAGTLTALMAMLLALQLARGEPKAALFAAAAMAFCAVSPTHVLFSRWAQQGVTVPLFLTAGLALAMSLPAMGERHRRAAAALAGLLLALACYAYAPARLVVPLVVGGLLLELRLWRREPAAAWRFAWPGAAIFAVAACALVVFTLTGGSERLGRISVFAGDRGVAGGALHFVANYAKHFDPRFLFLFGDANPRHAMPLAGIVAWAETPFFLAGLATLANLRRRGSVLLLVWLLAAPVAAALTNDGVPHALRSILLFPVVHLIAARGVVLLAERTSPRVAATCAGACCLATLALCVVAMKTKVARDAASWQYGVLEAMDAMWRANPQGPNALGAEVPYAHYYVLFFERPSAAAWHEEGPAVLRTAILAPGGTMPEGALVARPNYDLFGRAGELDVRGLSGDETAPPVMTIRPAR